MANEDYEGSGDSVVDALNKIGYEPNIVDDEGCGDMCLDALNDEVREYKSPSDEEVIMCGEYWNVTLYRSGRTSAGGKLYEIDLNI